MFNTVFFCIAFTSLFWGLLLCPKKEGKLNGIKQIIITFVTIMCIMSAPVMLFKVLEIPVNLTTLGMSCLLSSLVCWYRIYQKRKVQEFYFPIYDVVLVSFWSICFWELFLHNFTKDLHLCYMNSDIANHFNRAMDVINTECVNTMFMTEVFNAVVIKLAMPFLEELYYYKAFIIGDALLNWIPFLFFYVMISDYLKGKWIKVLVPIIGLLYFGGYPIYSYLIGGFVYWGIGTMFIGYVIYLLKVYLKETQYKILLEMLIMLGCCAIGVSYSLFVPMAFVAIFVVLCVRTATAGKGFSKSDFYSFVRIFGLPCVALFFLIIFVQFGSVDVILEGLATDGGIYANLYLDFIFFIPLILYSVVNAVKKRQLRVEHIFLSVFLAFTFILLVLCALGVISKYYYYKMYYPLWLLCWVITIHAIMLFFEEKNIMGMSYLVMLVAVSVIQFSGIPEKIIERVPNIQIEEADADLLYIYRYNYKYASNPFPRRDDSKLNLYNYVLNELYSEGENVRNVPVITTKDYFADGIWYDGITGNRSKKYYAWETDLEYIENRLEEKSDYFLVFKDSEFFAANDDFLSNYSPVYEDENGIIYKVAD